MELAKQLGISENQLKIMQNIFAKYSDITKVVVFGSRSQGKNKHFSDIDLCIVSDDVSQKSLVYAKEDLFESDLIYKVDLHTFDNISSEKLKSRILRDGIVIWER